MNYCIIFQISVCEMVETRSGFRQKSSSTVIEMNKAKRSDDYATFAAKEASALSLKPKPKTVLQIFKVSGGAVIQKEDIPFKGKQQKWTQGNYLSLLNKSPSAVKIGVGYLDDVHAHLSDSEFSTCSSEDAESVVGK